MSRLPSRTALMLVLSSVLILGALPSAQATDAFHASAPSHVQQTVPQARILGQGSFRWFGLKIYDAVLWSGPRGLSGALPSDRPFALDLRYARSLPGKKISDASSEQIQKLGMGTTEQRVRWHQDMQKLFPDVQEGTQLTGVYVPATGARFYLDGKLLGSIDDPQFADAFFAIWLSDKTTAPQLRQALLGRSPSP